MTLKVIEGNSYHNNILVKQKLREKNYTHAEIQWKDRKTFD